MSMGPSGPAGVVSARCPFPRATIWVATSRTTITIDWQTPSVSELAGRLVAGIEDPEERVRRLFAFVRDEVDHALDVETGVLTCRASEVLQGAGRALLCEESSARGDAALRGLPDRLLLCAPGFGRGAGPVLRIQRRLLEAVDDWIFLDARGGARAPRSGVASGAPSRLLAWPDADRSEAFLPTIHRRPAPADRRPPGAGPDLASVRRHLPDSI
ncbi:MAG: hypothetical protein R3F16_17015 [Myxococcota bacterium]